MSIVRCPDDGYQLYLCEAFTIGSLQINGFLLMVGRKSRKKTGSVRQSELTHIRDLFDNPHLQSQCRIVILDKITSHVWRIKQSGN